MSTLDELRVLVKDRGQIADDDFHLTPQRLTRIVNAALRKVSLTEDWPWLYAESQIATVAGTNTYSAPSDFNRVYSIHHNDNGDQLQRRGVRYVESFDTNARGRPSVYAIKDDEIIVAPTPDSAYTLNLTYVRFEPKLASDTSVPLIPDGYMDGVIEWGAYLANRAVNNSERAEESRRAFREWLTDARDNVNRGQESLRIRVRSGSMI